MNKQLYDIIIFPIKHGNCGGSLIQFQPGDEAANALPFEIGKVLVSWDMQPDDVRGNHAHHETEEIVVALSGGCTFDLDDGRGHAVSLRLTTEGVEEYGSKGVGGSENNPHTPTPPYPHTQQPPHPASRIPHPASQSALLLYPHIWRRFYDFEPDTKLLVVANMNYDEADYIRDREEFERLAKEWDGLGGSWIR